MRVALLLLISVAGGCSAFSQLQPGKHEASVKAQQSHDMQQTVMRFADEYAGGVSESLVRLMKTRLRPKSASPSNPEAFSRPKRPTRSAVVPTGLPTPSTWSCWRH
jgi:hypothetical protein